MTTAPARPLQSLNAELDGVVAAAERFGYSKAINDVVLLVQELTKDTLSTTLPVFLEEFLKRLGELNANNR